MSGAIALLPLDAATYRPHALHLHERVWSETNCYVDLWIEVLHSWGLDPVAGFGFLLAADFDGEQWEFLKLPIEDLRVLYGVDVAEINVYRSIEEHVVEHLRLGHLTTVEVDAWFLPDTAGTSYRNEHQKTTIAPQCVDVAARRMGYFHNRSYFELEGDDYVGALRLEAPAQLLVPYVERVSFQHIRRPASDELRADALTVARRHLARRPASNPVARMSARLRADAPEIQLGGQELFHKYAFGTLRQCGAWAELLADHVDWLLPTDGGAVVAELRTMAETAKTTQFKLARLASGRSTDLEPLLAALTDAWDRVQRAMPIAHG